MPTLMKTKQRVERLGDIIIMQLSELIPRKNRAKFIEDSYKALARHLKANSIHYAKVDKEQYSVELCIELSLSVQFFSNSLIPLCRKYGEKDNANSKE